MMSKNLRYIQIFLIIAIMVVLGLRLWVWPNQRSLPVLGKIEDFQLTNSSGQTVNLSSFNDRIWLANFIFTTCSDICPMMTKNMRQVYQQLANKKEIQYVSFTVNPENDTPDVLSAYAQKYDIDTQRWFFLTGSREAITQIAVNSFKLGDMKEPIFHSSYFALVDKDGNIRGYYDGKDPQVIKTIINDLKQLAGLPVLPTINATLNAIAGLFLILGFWAVKTGRLALHRNMMISAITASTLFLACYLYYHFTSHLVTRYQGQGVLRAIYFFILGTHTPLATIIVPFIFIAVWHAFKGNLVAHKKITRWLYPTWVYVSITGVLIYLMLYILPS